MRRRDRPIRASGFALVITILLLGLLVLAVLALSALVRVDGQVTATSVYQTQARQNALLALDIALADLQKKAGPDRRATATAGILSGTDASKQYWTGVWDNTGGLLGWLVSGDSTSVTSAVSAGTEGPLVALVGPHSVGVATTEQVAVQTRAIQVTGVPGYDSGQPVVVGHYGYWVGDEGVKASVNFAETLDRLDSDGAGSFSGSSFGPTTDEAKRLRQMLLPRPRIEEIASNLDPTNATTRANLVKVEAFDQIGAAASGTVQLASDFHDLTVRSAGVLSNPVDGGLKIDFSASGGAEQAAGAAVNGWKNIRPSAQTGTTAQHRFAGPASGLSVAPFVTEFAVRFAFFRNAPSTSAATGNLALNCQMQVELWNPYTSTLTSDGQKSLRIRVSGLPENLIVTTGAGQTFTVNLQQAVAAMDFSLPPDTALAPGAVTTFYGGSVWSSTSATAAGKVADVGGDIPSATSALRTLAVASATPAESTTLSVSLSYADETIAAFSPSLAFSAVNAPAQTWGNSGSANDTWAFGYGYAVKDSLAFWADGSAGAAMDPHASLVSGSFAEGATSIWQSDPVLNKSRVILRSSSGGGTFYGSASAPVYMLFELPQQEVVSLGSLQHVPGTLPNQIGNPWGGAANAVFDKAFVSTLPRGGIPTPVAELPTVPNAYLELYHGSTAPEGTALQGATTAAGQLLVRGSFNINSISAKAWAAVLGGAKVPAGYTLPSTALTNAFYRHAHSAQDNSTSAQKPTGAATARKQGVRDLSEDQVGAIGNAVAQFNRNRSRPYLSLEDFVNAGPITAALDPATSAIGTETSANVTTRQAINGGSTLVKGMPSYLTQADVLTSIAPFIAARSDTFRIRVYGDAVNPADTTQTEATAYCEAIVQRAPEFVDATQSADAAPPNATNAALGRRFVITYFRWLGPDDI